MNFDEAKRGYSKEQVDAYIKIVSDEYQKLLEEHQELETKINEDMSYSEAIAAALINAELYGKQIIASAKIEAKRINSEAKQEVKNLNNKKEIAMEEMRILSEQIQAVIEARDEQEKLSL